jgi:hypothetical protein
MRRVGDLIFVIVFLGGLAAWVIWGWVNWAQRRPAFLSAATVFSVIGFSLASLSALLQIGSGVYAQFNGGFPFNDPTLLHIYGIGLLLSLLGLLSGLCGLFRDGPLRFKAPALSAFLLLLWFAHAISE